MAPSLTSSLTSSREYVLEELFADDEYCKGINGVLFFVFVDGSRCIGKPS